jgi:hypothetical protein
MVATCLVGRSSRDLDDARLAGAKDDLKLRWLRDEAPRVAGKSQRSLHPGVGAAPSLSAAAAKSPAKMAAVTDRDNACLFERVFGVNCNNEGPSRREERSYAMKPRVYDTGNWALWLVCSEHHAAIAPLIHSSSGRVNLVRCCLCLAHCCCSCDLPLLMLNEGKETHEADVADFGCRLQSNAQMRRMGKTG